MQIIETRGLTKRYGRLTAVDDISFEVERGQVFGFLGPNGSGKTTTIGMLLGIITPTSGRIRLFGLEGRRGLHQARQRVGATLENPNFYPYLSGLENLRIVANVKGVDARGVAEALDTVGLAKRQKERYRAYSLGMKQRLAIAATMLGDPELIVLDEPANGLDPEGMREIREIIRSLAARGRTVFVSSHLLHEVERTCTHVAIIKRGRIVRQASVRELVASTTAVSLSDGRDVARLLGLVERYPGAASARIEGDVVVAELTGPDTAALNRWLAERDVYLSELALRPITLEDAFIDLTRDDLQPAGAA